MLCKASSGQVLQPPSGESVTSVPSFDRNSGAATGQTLPPLGLWKKLTVIWGGGGMMLSLVPSRFPAGPPGPRFPICEMESLDFS